MSKYYNKAGDPMTVQEWGKRFEDRDYKIIEQTVLRDGKWVSTVWLGLDHRWDDNGPPLIFETMVFPNTENLSEIDMERYSTLEDAEIGHAAMVTKWNNGGNA